jgi:peptide/nickel transport system ATP-binding protein
MYAGQIVEVAPATEFFAAPRHPYAQALLRALPDASRRGVPLEAIAGSVPPLTQSFSGCRYAPRCPVAMPSCADTRPELRTTGSRHPVRCLRVEQGADAASAPAVPAAVPPPSDADAVLLDVQDLWVRFPLQRSWLGGTRSWFDAVQGVSFQVRRGQTLALVGESGCGKTTTGKAIVQLLRDIAAIEGRALWEGRNLFELQGAALRDARRDVQIIFQDPYASLDPRMRVAEVLDEGLAALRPEMDATARRERLTELTERVGLRRDALDRYPHEFSGGQRQRIAIARALAVQPKLIVCDEPTSALDVSVQAQILNLLRELQRELGVSYLFITHNIGVVEYIADRIAVMNAGRIEEQGRSDEVLRAPEHEYTRRLLAAVPRLQTVA